MQLTDKFDKTEILFGHVNSIFFCNSLDMLMVKRTELILMNRVNEV